MIASTHLALGAASGLAIQKNLPESFGLPERITIGFAMGVLTHVLADALPHREYMLAGYSLWLVLAFEIAAVFFVIYYPVPDRVLGYVFFSAMLGAAFPDILSMSYEHFVRWAWVWRLDNHLHSYHGKIPIGFKISLIDQVLSAVALLGLVKFILR